MVNKNGSVFLYAMMLSFFAVIAGYIVVLKMDVLTENVDIQVHDSKLHSNITEKATLAIAYNTLVNTDGSGFTNTIACPSVTLSGTTGGGKNTIPTSHYFQGGVFVCSGSTAVPQGNLILSYSASGNTFTTGSYLSSEISLLPLNSTGARSGRFTDSFQTDISFTTTDTWSQIDLNGDSDDFQPYSDTNTKYPNDGYRDNDDMGRKNIYGYVKKDTGWYSVFSMNTPLVKYIASNAYNTGSGGVLPGGALPGNTQSGYLYVDIDQSYTLKIMEFNKKQFDSIGVLELEPRENTISTGPNGAIGWVMQDMSISGTTDIGSRKVFDLKNKDYAIFLSFSGNDSNKGVDFLKYKISMQDEQGTDIYIVPINDWERGTMKYFGNDIIIDSDGDYRYKQFEVLQNNTIRPFIINGCTFGSGTLFGSGSTTGTGTSCFFQ